MRHQGSDAASWGRWYRSGGNIVVLPAQTGGQGEYDFPAPGYPSAPGYMSTGGSAPAPDYTQCDFIDSHIDVYAQRALYQMVKAGGESRRAAIEMLSAVKAYQFGGIYQEDQREPALRARKFGKGWWQIIPQGQGAVCIAGSGTDLPIIAFKKALSSDLPGLGRTLLIVWQSSRCRPQSIQITPPSGRPCPPRPAGSPPPPPCNSPELRRQLDYCDEHFSQCRKLYEDYMNLDLARCQGNETCRNQVYAQWLPYLQECDDQYRACREAARKIAGCYP